MGMFDYVRCKYPLPDGEDGNLPFQTKDTPSQYLETYELRADRTLWLGEERVMFDGDLCFYHSNVMSSGPRGIVTSDDKPKTWWEYTALFKDGKLIDIRGGKTVNEDQKSISREEFDGM